MNRIGMGIAVALGVVFTCGCRGGGRTVPPPEPEERVAAQEAPGKESAAGTEKEMVTFTGEAGNAKLGAVVVVDGAPTYLAGLDAWPEDVVGKTVEVEGWLTTSDAHEAVQDETGAWSQGTDGPIRILEDAEWKVAGKVGCEAALESVALCFHESVSAAQAEPGDTPLGRFLFEADADGEACASLDLAEGDEALVLDPGGEVSFEKNVASHDDMGESETTHIVYTFTAEDCAGEATTEIQLQIGPPPS